MAISQKLQFPPSKVCLSKETKKVQLERNSHIRNSKVSYINTI